MVFFSERWQTFKLLSFCPGTKSILSDFYSGGCSVSECNRYRRNSLVYSIIYHFYHCLARQPFINCFISLDLSFTVCTMSIMISAAFIKSWKMRTDKNYLIIILQLLLWIAPLLNLLLCYLKPCRWFLSWFVGAVYEGNVLELIQTTHIHPVLSKWNHFVRWWFSKAYLVLSSWN